MKYDAHIYGVNGPLRVKSQCYHDSGDCGERVINTLLPTQDTHLLSVQTKPWHGCRRGCSLVNWGLRIEGFLV